MNTVRAGKSDLALACGAFTVACSCVVLAGWAYGVDDLKALFVRNVPVVPPFSAISLGVLGVSLVLFGLGVWEQVARVCAALATGFGLISLAASLAQIEFSFFLLLFRDQVMRDFPATAGRPASQTAFSMVALGAGLLTVWSKRKFWWLASQTALVIAFSGAWITLFSFTINASEIYHRPWHPASGMSIFAACAVALLAIGSLSIRTDAGIGQLLVSRSLGGKYSRFLLVVTLFVPLVLGTFVLRSSERGGRMPTELTTWAVAVYCLSIAGVAAGMSWRAGVYESKLLDAQKDRDEVISRLQNTIEQARRLEADMVRICGSTNTIEDEGRWIPFEQFLTERLHLQVTHSISPEALEKLKRGEKQPH